MTEISAPTPGASREKAAGKNGSKVIWIVGLAAVGLWAYIGFASPDTLLRYATGDTDACTQFAEKNKETLFFGKSKIKAMDYWLKNGKMVVEVAGYNQGDETYTPRICVVGGGTVQIVSIFENNAWR